MELGRVALALLLPWTLGLVWLRWCSARLTHRHWAMELGYAYVLGMLALSVILRILDALGLALDFVLIVSILFILILIGAWLAKKVPCAHSAPAITQMPWQRVLCTVLLALIAARIALLGLELYWRPLTPWDAWASWVVRAKVWFAFEQLVPFVDRASWLSTPGETVYTIDAWHYPATVPLIQLWPVLSYGQWLDWISHLPWLLCAVALALGFYGQIRLLGLRPLVGMVITYLLISLPLLDTHIALAGYADLWMMTVFAFAVLAFIHWLRVAHSGQGLIALLLLCVCPLIKTEGAVWLLILLPALAVMKMATKWLLVFTSLAIVLIGAWYWQGGFSLTLPWFGELIIQPKLVQLPLIGVFEFAWQGQWQPFIDNLFILGSWHLLWYLLAVVLLVSLFFIFKNRLLFAVFLLVLAGLAMLFVLFFLSQAQAWAGDYTSINRLFLHLSPVLLFYTVLLVQQAQPTKP